MEVLLILATDRREVRSTERRRVRSNGTSVDAMAAETFGAWSKRSRRATHVPASNARRDTDDLRSKPAACVYCPITPLFTPPFANSRAFATRHRSASTAAVTSLTRLVPFPFAPETTRTPRGASPRVAPCKTSSRPPENVCACCDLWLPDVLLKLPSYASTTANEREFRLPPRSFSFSESFTSIGFFRNPCNRAGADLLSNARVSANRAPIGVSSSPELSKANVLGRLKALLLVDSGDTTNARTRSESESESDESAPASFAFF